MRYLYQRDNMLALLQERDTVGTLLAHYTGGAGAPEGDGLESQRRGEDSSFHHYDWLGSTHELTDAAQAVTDTYRYDAWGTVLEATGSTVNPHTYVGRLRYYAMAGTGLYQLGYRELAAGVGRFLSVDPARSGPDWFAYVSGRPSRHCDPRGLQQDPSLSALGGADLTAEDFRIPVKSPIDWLNAHPEPKRGPERIEKIEELLYDLATLGELKYALAPRLLKRWLSGRGDTTVSFGALLDDAAFHQAYRTLIDKLLSDCCHGNTRVVSGPAGHFGRGDLFLSFNWWDHLAGRTLASWTTRAPCFVRGVGEGLIAGGWLWVEFRDGYNWEPDNKGPFYAYGKHFFLGEVRQAWFLEYKAYAHSTNRRNRYGGPPRNFTTTASRLVRGTACCVGGRAYPVGVPG